MTNRSRSLIATAILGALSMSAGLPAFAGESVASETVKFHDLSLANPQHASALYARIRSAAQRVCSQGEDRDLLSVQRVSACIRNSIAQAVSAVNRPTLFDVYNLKNGTSGMSSSAAAALIR